MTYMLADLTLIADFVAAFCVTIYIVKLLREGPQVEQDAVGWDKLSLQAQKIFKRRLYNRTA